MLQIVPNTHELTDDECVLVNAYWWLCRAKYENSSVFEDWPQVDCVLGLLERNMGKRVLAADRRCSCRASLS